MVKIVVENFSEDALKKLYCDLDQKEDWTDNCELCEMPTLLHNGKGTCTRMSVSELDEAWWIFRKKMKPIRKWYTANMEEMQMDSNFLQELKEHEQKDHEWKCDLCEKQYTSIKELKEHEKEYHEQKCDRCEKQYVYIKELDEHLKKEHGIRRYKCTECGKEFENLEELIEHEKNCYTCNLCDYGRTMNRRDFEDHIDWKHDKDCYTCGQCRNWYENREDLEDHRRRRHTKYNCDQCDKWYDRKEDLEDHKKRRHTKECENKLVCRNEREQQKKEEYRERFVCKLCEKNFKDKSELREHWKKDHASPIYYWYKSPVYERVHLYCEEEMETQVMEIGCMKCNITFESEEEIIKHIKWICDGIEHGIVKNVES